MSSAPGAPPVRIWKLPLDEAISTAMDRLGRVRRRRIEGTLHRAMYAKFLAPPVAVHPEPLYFTGSLAGRRFTPRMGPAGLYLSFDPSTPPAELRAVVFEHGFPFSTEEHDPIVTVAVRTVIHRVLDLTDASTRRRLGLTVADLRADWEHGQDEYLAGRGPMPATQILALTAICRGFSPASSIRRRGLGSASTWWCSPTAWRSRAITW